MKNLGNNFMILVVFAGVGVYVIGQVFGTPAAVAAILFASHALCLVAGYGMGIGGAKAGMDAVDDEHLRELENEMASALSSSGGAGNVTEG